MHATPDVLVLTEGSIVLFTPLSPDAKQWFEQHLPADAMTWGPSTVVEWRYADDIVSGMTQDGLQVTSH